ncbi:amino acid ABC transporter permease [Actinomycetospora sp. TBRC 11914]|uniref:amino acid ABC transporter permease n=1 Tax=Actinomycetospora sp. TBRC 11914 TaxID=2729387 RepID=UPI0028A12ACE|nr:amino acid ABC transporter permease [Actinomycetospora sp. TBRC 11914]
MPPPLPSTGEAVEARPERPAEPDLTAQRVVPLRHPGRWIATVVVLVLLAQVVHGLITNPFYQWDRFTYWFARPVVLQGLLITLEVTAISAVLALAGGIVLALMRRSQSPVLQTVSWAYIWLFRSVPLIVLLLFLYNFSALYKVLGLGVPFGPQFVTFGVARLGTDLVIAIVGLSLNAAAFAAEVVRSGLLSVDQGQHEAAAALGLPRIYQFRHIVLPQALRTIVPSYVNVLIDIVKGSSLVFYVSLLDLFGQVQSLGSTYPGDIVPLLVVATVWYVVLTSVISVVQYYVERRFARGAERTLPPTPLQRLRRTLGSIRSIGAAR